MTGPEHYKEAESLIRRASFKPGQGLKGVTGTRPFKRQLEPDEMIATAHVHAILALAAATALASSAQEHADDPQGVDSRVRQAWEGAAAHGTTSTPST